MPASRSPSRAAATTRRSTIEIHCTLIRAQEMPRYVENGSLDCGLTGHDWVLENEANVTNWRSWFSKVSRRPVRWVLAVPNDSPIKT